MDKLELQIRKARPQDLPYIEEKMQKYLLDATDISWEQFFVLENDHKVVAFGRVKDHGEYLELASLGVDYYHRKKGYGNKMLAFLIGEARRMDSKKPIYGVTHLSEWLKKFGFEEVREYPEYLDYKKNHVCKHPHKIKIMKLME